MIFTADELAYLASQRLGRLATLAPDGGLQNSPVGYHVNADGSIDIMGYRMGATRKFANVRSHPRVAFVVDDLVSVDPWEVHCLEIRGDAEAVEDVEPARRGFSRQVIRIHPRRIISFGINPGQDGLTGRSVAWSSTRSAGHRQDDHPTERAGSADEQRPGAGVRPAPHHPQPNDHAR